MILLPCVITLCKDNRWAEAMLSVLCFIHLSSLHLRCHEVCKHAHKWARPYSHWCHSSRGTVIGSQSATDDLPLKSLKHPLHCVVTLCKDSRLARAIQSILCFIVLFNMHAADGLPVKSHAVYVLLHSSVQHACS